MTPLLWLVVYMAIVTWASLNAASQIRTKGWTLPGMKLAMGNRDNLAEPSPLAGRADRAARNTAENFMLFAALAVVAHVGGVQSPKVLLGAEVFFWSRLVYLVVHLRRNSLPAHGGLCREHRRSGHDDLGHAPGTVIIDIGTPRLIACSAMAVLRRSPLLEVQETTRAFTC